MIFRVLHRRSSAAFKERDCHKFISACRDGQLSLAMSLYTSASPLEQARLRSMSDENRVTPLMHAAANARSEVAAWLVKDVCVDIDAQDRDGTTALMRAAFWNHEAMLQFLVEQGHANVEICNKRGRSALEIAQTEQCKDYLLKQRSRASSLE